MRFERIFDDLEGRFAHHQREETLAISEELTRAERAQVTLTDRLRGAGGRTLVLHVGAALRVQGEVEEVGADWVALTQQGSGRRAVIPLARIALLHGLPSRVRPAEESLRSPLGIGSVLREIARDRSVVRVETVAGGILGRIGAVGADALDVHSLPTGETAAAGTERITVATSALLAVLPR